MKLIFFGTPETAVPFLSEASSSHQVAAVVSQPDKPAGRGLATSPTPVKVRALELGLKVLQPARPSEALAELKFLAPDLAVVVAYGRLLKADVLGAARLGAINVHFSLLPKYRGAAPVQWSLVNGERRSGVTIFWLDEGMDTGPMQSAKEIEVGPDEDAASLLSRLTELGVVALREALTEIAAGRIRREPQVGEPTLAPLLRKEDGRLSFDWYASRLHDRVRGLSLWPKAYFELSNPSRRLVVLRTALEVKGDTTKVVSPVMSPVVSPVASPAPGTILAVDRTRGFLVQCADGSRLWFVLVQPDGKKPIPAADFLNGLRLGPGKPFPAA